MLIDELRVLWNEALSYRGRCPRCDSTRVWRNGIRVRKASLFDGERTVFVADVPARRLRCGDCAVRWTHTPERVVSRGQYQPCVVAPAVARAVLDPAVTVTAIAREQGSHRRTLGRWIARIARIADPAVLARILLAESATPVIPAPPEAVRRGALGARAVWVLALLEALASLRGLAPPALAHASLLVPAHAPAACGPGGASSPM